MIKSLIGLAMLLVIHISCFAQNIPGFRVPLPGEEKELLMRLNQTKAGIPQVELLLNLGACYLYLPGEEKDDLNKAMSYALQAKRLSTAVQFEDGYIGALVLSGEVLLESGEFARSRIVLDSALIYLRSNIVQTHAVKSAERDARALLMQAAIFSGQKKYQLAEIEYLKLIAICKEKRFNGLECIYHRLALMYTVTGDYDKALSYSLEAVRIMDSKGDFSYGGPIYRTLGLTYRFTGKFQMSIDSYNKAMQFYNKNSSTIMIELMDLTCNSLLKMRRYNEAILLLRKTAKEFPVQNNHDKKVLERSFGYYYRVLKQYDSAEVHYKRAFELRPVDGAIDVESYKAMGQLYVEAGKYSMARPYLDTTLKFVPLNFPTSWFAHLHFLMFKADSASGNYLSAISHLMKNKDLDDIIYEQNKVRNNQELQIKYETEKKDQDIKLKEQSILLLNRLADLQKKDLDQAGLRLLFESTSKEQSLKIINAEAERKDRDLLINKKNLELLQNKNLLQQSNLRQATTGRNMFIGGAIMLFLLLLLLYNRYRLKQISNRQLQAQQKDINSKNAELQLLLNEKEWLLKEVHHRVKNNLHTVMSLLESQSAYLENDALTAIKDSQHRVYAMSLIHQKLYQAEDLSTINMAVYLPELVNYLSESFNLKEHIRFNLQIAAIELDVSQAIPIGLILNEAITNAIKYAFPLSNNNQISISMKNMAANKTVLIIADNGIGLPAGFNTLRTEALGIKLMKGLAEDIGGRLDIEGSHGCRIELVFTLEPPLHEAQKLIAAKNI
jgi:two-component system, sensor histidine kinase PdtaS